MKSVSQSAVLRCALAAGFACFAAAAASAQVPAPIAVPIAEEAIPIIINTVKPHKGPQPPKFEGTVLNATIAQITVRAKGNDMGIQIFPLTPEAAAKMLQIIDMGGFFNGTETT